MINIISIVGRFLEHSRIYIFGPVSRQKVYIASADFMTRNTVRRVEVATPIYDRTIKRRKINDIPLNSQEYFYEQAYANECK